MFNCSTIKYISFNKQSISNKQKFMKLFTVKIIIWLNLTDVKLLKHKFFWEYLLNYKVYDESRLFLSRSIGLANAINYYLRLKILVCSEFSTLYAY